MDTLLTLHKFSEAVAKSLNDAKVTPPIEYKEEDDDCICAVMIVVGVAPEPPLGAALNWDVKGGYWRVDAQAQEAQRADSDEH